MEVERLTSLKNPQVQLWRSLKDRKARREHGLFLVEGRKSVEEALSSGFPAEALLLREDTAEQGALPENVKKYLLPEHVMAAVCDTRTPQGIAAVMRHREIPVEGRRLVALDGVQDPGNVGTVIRTMDAAGYHGLLMDEKTADPYSPKALRASMGGVFRVPVLRCDDLPGQLRSLARDGFDIVAGDLHGEPFYQRRKAKNRLCVVIGNEGQGVSPAVFAESTLRLKLPMVGGAESLNAAVAAGIMMYDFLREKGGY